MRTKDEALSTHRRREILAAAAIVFKQKGFHGARTEDICEKAQLSPGTVFRHFESKKAIIEAIAHEELSRYGDQVQQLSSQDGLRWMAKLTRDDLLVMLAPSEFDLGSDSWLELSRSPQGRTDIEQAHKKLHEVLASALARGQKDGWVRASINPSGMATVILALLTGLSFDTELALTTDHTATAKAIADLIAACVLY
jgi:TetR/AcrR family transcriptional regulator, repressor for uid operon